MKKSLFLIIFSILSLSPGLSLAQNVDKLGAWYMYFFNTKFKESEWGVQGDVQYRNWNLGGDLEQLLLRGGLTYQPKDTDIKFTLGYGHITSGKYDSDDSHTYESRIYQEALLPTQVGSRFYFKHRFRYEQRFVEGDDFRTRYRYNLFLNIPLNNTEIDKETIYLALYDEIFINGQRDTGNGNKVEIFDRNRLYLGMGYAIKKSLKVQLGFMRQTTDNLNKNQLQVSLHHKF